MSEIVPKIGSNIEPKGYWQVAKINMRECRRGLYLNTRSRSLRKGGIVNREL